MTRKIFDSITAVIDKRFLIAGAIIAFLGVYLGVLFFGENSIFTYFALREEKQNLTNRIIELKNSNAVLQKKYFELKQQNRNKNDE